jgi:hypothetical protein
MPRPWELTVEDFPPRKPGCWYNAKVCSLQKSESPAGLQVTLEDLDPEQLGRQTSIVLPLPLRPSGITRDFFVACGQDVSLEKRINPKTVLGAVLAVRFGLGPAGPDVVPVAFNPNVTRKPQHDQ